MYWISCLLKSTHQYYRIEKSNDYHSSSFSLCSELLLQMEDVRMLSDFLSLGESSFINPKENSLCYKTNCGNLGVREP
jgi:hypothetical protein